MKLKLEEELKKVYENLVDLAEKLSLLLLYVEPKDYKNTRRVLEKIWNDVNELRKVIKKEWGWNEK